MSKPKDEPAVTRRPHPAEFKSEALGLAERIGAAIAAKPLGLYESRMSP